MAAGGDRLRALAYHLFGSRDAVDDVLQEVHVRAYRHLAEFRGESTIATWLYRVTCTTCMDHLRREDRIDPVTPDHRLLIHAVAFEGALHL